MKKTNQILYLAKMNYEKYSFFIRFAMVGALNTLVDFSVFSLLTGVLGMHHSVSQVISYSSGIINSFILNKVWTFQNKTGKKKTAVQFTQFIMVNAVSLGASLISLDLLLDTFMMNKYMAKTLVTVLAQAINFSGYKLWVFVKRA